MGDESEVIRWWKGWQVKNFCGFKVFNEAVDDKGNHNCLVMDLRGPFTGLGRDLGAEIVKELAFLF